MANAVLTGADQFPEWAERALAGRRFGLLTNPTGIDSRFRSTIDRCAGLGKAQLAALFACEHGLRGERQAGVKFGDEFDPELGLPVYSLYGERREPTAQMLEGLDAVVIDIQDLGVRFYTYLTTLVHVMRACAEYGPEVIVLDRPNPLGGAGCEGGCLKDGFRSMVGPWNVPFRTGLTIGEFARLVQSQMERPCRLRIIPLQGWRRPMEYPDTGLPWIMPSPNMPTLDTVRVYPGNCLFEGTNLSEGRGTTRPFEMIGAPWLRHRELCEEMNKQNLPGVYFHPVTFTPLYSKHQGRLCRGVMTFVTDRSRYKSVDASLRLLRAILCLHPDAFEWLPPAKPGAPYFIDLLSGSDRVRLTLHEPGGLESILADWQVECRQWEQIRRSCLLYE